MDGFQYTIFSAGDSDVIIKYGHFCGENVSVNCVDGIIDKQTTVKHFPVLFFFTSISQNGQDNKP